MATTLGIGTAGGISLPRRRRRCGGFWSKTPVASRRRKLAADGIGVSVLCPGPIKSRIHESGRNRPERFRAGSGFEGAEALLDRVPIDLAKDPEVLALRGQLRFANLVATAPPEAELAARLAANPKDKRGAHRYTLEQFGLDPMDLKQQYQFYLDRFGVECST